MEHLPASMRGNSSLVYGPWLEVADFTLDALGHIASWSPAAQHAYGYGADEVLGRHFSLLYMDEHLEAAEQLLVAARQHGYCSEVVQRRRRDRAPVAMQARVVAYAAAKSHLTGYAEIDLPLGQGEGGRSDLAADRLIRLAAHELRSPLGVVLGALTLLDMETEDSFPQPTPSARTELLALARDELRQMDDLLGSILGSWRTHQEAFALRLRSCDLQEIVAAGMRSMLSQRDRVQIEAPLHPLPLQGDPDRLQQVLRNLLGNAVKYSPAGTPIVMRVEQRDEVLRVSVLDLGVGIDGVDAERIFERHYRGRRQPAVDPGGMGLGLYVCRSIVEGHGGRIWAQRREGEGLCVSLELPRLQASIEST